MSGKETPLKKPAAAKKSRTQADPSSNLKANPWRDDSLTSSLMEFVQAFPPKLDGDKGKLKTAIQKKMMTHEWTRLMPYWSRSACGIKVLQEDLETFKPSFTISFTSSSAPERFKMAMAVRCADLAVTLGNIWDEWRYTSYLLYILFCL